MPKANIIEEYKGTHPGSDKLHQRALRVFPAEGATHKSRILKPFRPYITHANGSHKWDVDGNEYIDYTMGHGALILGHSHPDVVRAVQEQMAKGVHFGENHELEVEWAELIKSMMPSAEKIEFFACGNEANMMALRLCRLATGRKKILKFEYHFHGWNDHLTEPGAPGTLPEDNMINTVNIPANDLDRLEKELAKKEYAALITEGGGGIMGGAIPLNIDFVLALPELAHKYDTIWVLDEVVTGFRDYRSGEQQCWQSMIGVKPDLTTLGKCIGGGLSVGALLGRTDLMEYFSPKKGVQQIAHTGTWNANPLTAAAGIAACKLYRTGEPQRKAATAAALLRQKGNHILKEHNMGARLYGRSIVHLYFGPIDYEPPEDTLPPTGDVGKLYNLALLGTRDRLCLYLLHRGVATLGARLFVLSSAHSKEDINLTVEALAESLDAMLTEGTLKKG
jgi:glutamate-1-semialdehyde 2,1-aminomutase